MQVYEKLAQVKSWNEWHTSAWVVRAPGQEKLLPGDRFSYTGTNFVMGNVQAEVSEASPSKVTTEARSLDIASQRLVQLC